MIAALFVTFAAVVSVCFSLWLREHFRADKSMPDELSPDWHLNTWIGRKDTLCGRWKR